MCWILEWATQIQVIRTGRMLVLLIAGILWGSVLHSRALWGTSLQRTPDEIESAEDEDDTAEGEPTTD
jgi:hypothetical protein